MGSKCFDMVDRLVDTGHDSNRERQIAMLDVPFCFLYQLNGGAAECSSGCTTAHSHRARLQASKERGHKFGRNLPIDKNSFDGVAGGRRLRLAVEDERNRHCSVRGCLHVDVAHTVSVTDHRNSGIGHDKSHQLRTAARYNQVHVIL